MTKGLTQRKLSRGLCDTDEENQGPQKMVIYRHPGRRTRTTELKLRNLLNTIKWITAYILTVPGDRNEVQKYNDPS